MVAHGASQRGDVALGASAKQTNNKNSKMVWAAQSQHWQSLRPEGTPSAFLGHALSCCAFEVAGSCTLVEFLFRRAENKQGSERYSTCLRAPRLERPANTAGGWREGRLGTPSRRWSSWRSQGSAAGEKRKRTWRAGEDRAVRAARHQDCQSRQPQPQAVRLATARICHWPGGPMAMEFRGAGASRGEDARHWRVSTAALPSDQHRDLAPTGS